MGKLDYFATDGKRNLCSFWAFILLFIAHLIVTMSVQPLLFEPIYPPNEEPNTHKGNTKKKTVNSTKMVRESVRHSGVFAGVVKQCLLTTNVSAVTNLRI